MRYSLRVFRLFARWLVVVCGRLGRRKSTVVRQRVMDASASLRLQAAVRGRLGRRKSFQVREGIQTSLERESATLKHLVSFRDQSAPSQENISKHSHTTNAKLSSKDEVKNSR